MILDIDVLMQEWIDDAAINRTDADLDLLNIPNLHAKYSAQLIRHNAALRIKRIEFNELLRVKNNYYSGNMNNKKELDTRGWEPFSYIPKGKNDLDSYLNSDKDLNALKEKLGKHEDAINFCEMVVKEISNRTWQIKAYLDYSKYKLGN